MHELWRALGFKPLRVEQLQILWKYAGMRRSRVVTGKHGMQALMLALKEMRIKTETIQVHMHHKQTSKKHLKDKCEILAVMVHVVQINKTITLPIPIEEECRQAALEHYDLGYIE